MQQLFCEEWAEWEEPLVEITYMDKPKQGWKTCSKPVWPKKDTNWPWGTGEDSITQGISLIGTDFIFAWKSCL